MLHDIFLVRYPAPLLYGDRMHESVHTIFAQAADIIASDFPESIKGRGRVFEKSYRALARELGIFELSSGSTYEQRCLRFICDRYDLWIDRHGSVDAFFKSRVSMIELIVRFCGESISEPIYGEGYFDLLKQRLGKEIDRNPERSAYSNGVDELNERFRRSQVGLICRNGYIQLAADDIIEKRVRAPLMAELQHETWSNVDGELKVAFDDADNARPDAVFHAAKALESTIKIICERGGLTDDKFRSASTLIDALVSEKGGRFLEAWEGIVLKEFFRNRRNPLGHGAGGSEPLRLTDDQRDWAIDSAVIWIKALIRRSSR